MIETTQKKKNIAKNNGDIPGECIINPDIESFDLRADNVRDFAGNLPQMMENLFKAVVAEANLQAPVVFSYPFLTVSGMPVRGSGLRAAVDRLISGLYGSCLSECSCGWTTRQARAAAAARAFA